MTMTMVSALERSVVWSQYWPHRGEFWAWGMSKGQGNPKGLDRFRNLAPP